MREDVRRATEGEEGRVPREPGGRRREGARVAEEGGKRREKSKVPRVEEQSHDGERRESARVPKEGGKGREVARSVTGGRLKKGRCQGA